MANQKISNMTATTALLSGDVFVIERSGVNRKIDINNVNHLLINKTNAEIVNLIGSSGLIPGRMYYITDDRVYLHALTANLISVHGAYYNNADDEIYYCRFASDTGVSGGGYIIEVVDQRNNRVNYYSLSTFKFGNENLYENTILGNCVVTTSGINATGSFHRNYFVGSVDVTANLNAGISVTDCIFEGTGSITLDPAVSVTGGVYRPGYSNFSRSYAITGLTTIDITASKNYIGKVTLTSSNATETINLFANFPDNHPVRFYPASGLTVTFTHNTGANQPTCAGGINAVVNGTNGDWIEFTKTGTRIYQTGGETY